MPKKQPLAKDVVDHWPEVLEDIDIQVVPLEYLHSVRITFEDGKVWDVDIEASRKKGDDVDVELVLGELFEEYDEFITNVDFRLDTVRLKEDITKRTRIFLKKRK